VSLHDASMDSRCCQAETPGSTSNNVSAAGYHDFFNSPFRRPDESTGF